MDDSHEQCEPEEAEKDDEVSQKRTGHTEVKERECDREESVKRNKHNRPSCCLERWRYKKTNRVDRKMNKLKKKNTLDGQNTGQEDELWKELAFEMENEILNKRWM